MKLVIHVIPVGGSEPIHMAGPACFCFPVLDPKRTKSGGQLYCHNAKDLRDVRERFNQEAPGDGWVMVDQQTEEEDPFQSPAYQKFVESMIPHCHCADEYKPCEGILAGGMCDNIQQDSLSASFDGSDFDDEDREHSYD